MHLFQPVADQLEGLAQALLQCGVQLFVNGAPHLVKLDRIVILNGGQPLVERAAQLLGRGLLALCQGSQLLTHRILQHGKLVAQLLAIAAQLILERCAHMRAHVRELLLDIAFERIQRAPGGFGQRLKALLHMGGLLGTALRQCGAGLVAICRQALHKLGHLFTKGRQGRHLLAARQLGTLLGLGQLRLHMLRHAVQRAIAFGHRHLRALATALQLLQPQVQRLHALQQLCLQPHGVRPQRQRCLPAHALQPPQQHQKQDHDQYGHCRQTKPPHRHCLAMPFALLIS